MRVYRARLRSVRRKRARSWAVLGSNKGLMLIKHVLNVLTTCFLRKSLVRCIGFVRPFPVRLRHGCYTAATRLLHGCYTAATRETDRRRRARCAIPLRRISSRTASTSKASASCAVTKASRRPASASSLQWATSAGLGSAPLLVEMHVYYCLRRFSCKEIS